jgi:hypothetical protein
MITELAFVKHQSFVENYMCVFNRQQASNLDEAKIIVDSIFPNIGEYTLEEKENEIYILTQNPLPCVNCQ